MIIYDINKKIYKKFYLSYTYNFLCLYMYIHNKIYKIYIINILYICIIYICMSCNIIYIYINIYFLYT